MKKHNYFKTRTWLPLVLCMLCGLPGIAMAQTNFSITKTWATASMQTTGAALYTIHNEGVGEEDFMGIYQTTVQVWDEEKNDWEDIPLPPKNSSSALSHLRSASATFSDTYSGLTTPGKYRFKVAAVDDEQKEPLVKYSKELELKGISSDTEWKDETFDALSISSDKSSITNVTFNNVSATYTKDRRSAVAIPLSSEVILHLTGDNSKLDSLTIGGKLLLTHDGETRFEDTKICNHGVFTDSTKTTLQKVYGPAGIWIESLEFLGDQPAPKEQTIKTVKTVWHQSNVLSSKKLTLEIYKDDKWVDYETAVSEETEPTSLRATRPSKEWPSRIESYFFVQEDGTYRIKYHITAKDVDVETTVYSKPFVMTATKGITDEQKEIGKEGETTELPALAISAGSAEQPTQASLTNVSIPTNETGVPSVIVMRNSNVELTLKGTNSLGHMEVSEGAAITLKLGSEEDQVDITSVRNGGKFVDETGTVSSVKDLENRTMIEFTDTIVAQIENVMSVSVRAIFNSFDGSYDIQDDYTTQKWDATTSEWVSTEPTNAAKTPILRAESMNQSGEFVATIATTEEGLYRIKLTSKGFADENKGMEASLYFVFEIKEVEATVISETPAEPLTGNHEMLIFKSSSEEEKTMIEATLNNVQVKEHETLASTVIMEKEKVSLTLNGDNTLGEFQVMKGADVTLKKGTDFNTLSTRIKNAGKFTDETGTIGIVEDSRGHTMMKITAFGCIESIMQFFVNVEFNSWEGYDTDETDVTVEKWNGTEWGEIRDLIQPEPNVLRDAPSDDEASGQQFIARTVTEPGEYRFKIRSVEWMTEGTQEDTHAATLYRYFTITEPEPTYYNVTLPSVTGATTSPAAGTYSEEEGSYFSFTLTLDPNYDQSKPEIKANGKVLSPNTNGTYTIEGIYEDITITITGVEENIPTGNAEVNGNEVKVWSAEGILHIYTPDKAALQVYAFKGGLVYERDAIIGEHTVSLNSGMYIVVVGGRSYKLSL